MGRPLRVQFPGAVYRVSLQADGAGRLFRDDADREAFLALLERTARHFGLAAHAFCLRPRRAELVLETPRGNLARAMQAFCTAYTKAFNRRRRGGGHVFRGRYGAELLESVPAGADLSCGLHAPRGAGLAPSVSRRPASPLPANGDAPALDPRRILEEVSLARGIAPERILGAEKNRLVSGARREAVYRAWEAGLTISALGRAFKRTPGGIVQMIRKREAAAA